MYSLIVYEVMETEVVADERSESGALTGDAQGAPEQAGIDTIVARRHPRFP